jgi:hypothetical protein
MEDEEARAALLVKLSAQQEGLDAFAQSLRRHH